MQRNLFTCGTWGQFHQFFTRSFFAQSAKKTDNLTGFLAFSGSSGVKAVLRTLMKLTPGRVGQLEVKLTFAVII